MTADGVGGALGVAAIGISSDTTGKEMSSAVIGTATTAGKAGGEAGRADRSCCSSRGGEVGRQLGKAES